MITKILPKALPDFYVIMLVLLISATHIYRLDDKEDKKVLSSQEKNSRNNSKIKVRPDPSSSKR